MKKWYKSWKIWCMLVAAILLVVLLPVGINEAYKIGEGYITVWTGSEFLAYYGTILGAVSTIIALVGTIVFTRRQILFERYIQSETEKWKEIENLFRDAIIFAEPVHLTTMFYNCLENPESHDVCLKLETYLTGLGKRPFVSLLLEGGGELAASALNAGVVDKIEFHYAPKILGGAGSRPVVGGPDPRTLTEAFAVNGMELVRLGPDFAVSGYVRKPEERRF
mgnify:CR=1 FL=1